MCDASRAVPLHLLPGGAPTDLGHNAGTELHAVADIPIARVHLAVLSLPRSVIPGGNDAKSEQENENLYISHLFHTVCRQ